MRVVFDDEGEILQASISDRKTPTCKEVCRFHDSSHIIDPVTGECSNCAHCSQVEAKEEAIGKPYMFQMRNGVLRKKKKYRIVWTTADVVLKEDGSTRIFTVPEGVTQIGFVISFEDSSGEIITPFGQMVLKASNGTIRPKKTLLDGTVSSVACNYILPATDNRDVRLRARIDGVELGRYNFRAQAVLERE